MTPEVLVADSATLAERVAAEFLEEGRHALAARGFFALALAGGSMAETFFPRLARTPFDWTRTEFFWVDERAVPISDPASNCGRAQSLWLGPAGVPPERIHRMFGGSDDPVTAVEAYSEELTRITGGPPRLDLVLVGVGADGHVASLFPDHAVLDDGRPVAYVSDAPKPPPRRMTLTLSVLTRASRVVIAAFGASKAAAVRDALDRPESASPAARLTRGARRPLWLLDHAAAR